VRRTLTTLTLLVCLGLFLAGAVPAAAGQDQAPVSSIKDITFQKVDDQLQVLIKIDGPFTFETLEVQEPQRLVLDFKSVSQIQAPPVLEVNDVGVTSIRTGQFQPDVARVVFDLADKAPSHSLTQTEDGLKVVFWTEAAAPQPAPPQPVEPKPEPAKPVQPEPAEVKPVPEAPAAATAEAHRGFFVRLAGGLGLPAMPDTTGTRNISLYFETGSLTETNSLKTGYLVDLAVGKYLSPRIRVGLGASVGSANTTAAIVASLPNPFVYNQPREVTFPSTELSNTVMNFYAFGLFTVLRSDKFELSVGPMLGYGTTNYQVLEDFGLTEKSPFTAADVTITDQTFSKDSLSSLTAGAWLAGQYEVGRNIFLTLDARLLYFDAKAETLGHRANLSTIGLLLGFQYNF
jgi:hypothetical protein